MKKPPEFSLILPCYNEEEHVIESVDRIFLVLKKFYNNFEIIFVEDNSTDNTKQILKQIVKKYEKHARVIFHDQNLGRGASVCDGILNSKSEIVGFIDIDCEISPYYIPIFVDRIMEGFEIVVANRVYELTIFSFHRWFASKAYAKLTKILFGLEINDTESGYKFFKKQKIKPVLNNTLDKRWFWDTEICVRANSKGLKISEIPVVFLKRKDKTSTVNLLSDSIIYIYNLIKLWQRVKNEK